MTVPLEVYAGHSALRHLHQHGLKPDDVSMLLGASSGPKWLVLHGIDQYLMEHFFKNRQQQPLHLLGTSAGAWRMACYAQSDPLRAHQRLTRYYIEQRYNERPSGDEVLASCRSMVKGMLGDTGVEEILTHPWARMHLITTQCHGIAATQSRPLQGAAFLLAAFGNLLHRRTLNASFTRVVMHHPNDQPPLAHHGGIKTRQWGLSRENLADSILSTGCIPVITKGVRDIAGKGLYQDGGITDYGFDLPFLPENGFVLYPHFHHRPAPGWFDKSLRWRKPDKGNYDKTILLIPSADFVASLPYGKIPDRNDFMKLSDQERINYWQEVVERSRELGMSLQTMDWQAARPLPW